jgi:hypothetical protein
MLDGLKKSKHALIQAQRSVVVTIGQTFQKCSFQFSYPNWAIFDEFTKVWAHKGIYQEFLLTST